MMFGTLSRYFGLRFLGVAIAIFAGLVALVAMTDFVEMLRRSSHVGDVSTLFIAKITLYRLPFLTERILPFAVNAAASFCYLGLSRRLELVVARSAGVSAWQFIAPAMFVAFALGVAATTLYNPISASLREESARLEAELFHQNIGLQDLGSGYWIRQRSEDGQAIINAKSSTGQGIELTGVTVFRFDQTDRFLQRIEAKSAVLHSGFWRLEEARIFGDDTRPENLGTYDLKTNLTSAQVRETFATPDTVPFWQLSNYIRLAENAGLAAAGYRVQFYSLLIQPLNLAAMVILAASLSLRSFRFGGVQRMVLAATVLGFLLYILAKVGGDVSKAGLMPPLLAAMLPPLVAGFTGLMTLLYLEDG
ncbi:MAG TPA: LPS export ABC transporter permease LptG [Xanthobacteraceae bacterium]|jgi:lipopolysaccharide export system permease protein